MIFLAASIILSSYLTIAFKLCDRWGINKFQAIVFNYLACALTGCFVFGSVPAYKESISEPWFKWAVLMGISFIIIFNMIALTVQKAGLAVASVASKLSLIIPFIFSVVLYNDHAVPVKIAGVLLALVAVVLTLYPDNRTPNAAKGSENGFSGQKIILPMAVFITTGLLDTLIKFVEQHFITQANNDRYLISSFTVAFVFGLFFLAVQLMSRKMSFQPKSIIAGLLIGIPNYFSIWCLMKVLKQYGNISSVIIPVNNMGIVLFSAMVAWLFFKEKLSPLNWAGIILAVLSIMMIAFGAKI
jgi:drug/metabolite transporter (DMT)-like permease